MSTTLLDIVQDILSSMDGDEVNTIGGTIESQQIATLIKKQFEQIVERYELPAIRDTFKLQGLGDVDHPTNFLIPEDCQSLEWVGYNVKREPADADNYIRIQYMIQGDFMDQVTIQRSLNSNIQTVELESGVKIYIQNDKPPEFYTSFNDRIIVMDSFLNTIDTTLQGSKTNCYGEKHLSLVIADSTVIPLPQHLVNLLYNESLEMCFALWKEGPPQRIQQDAMRTRVRSQRVKNRYREQQEQVLNTGPDYGRRRPM